MRLEAITEVRDDLADMRRRGKLEKAVSVERVMFMTVLLEIARGRGGHDPKYLAELALGDRRCDEESSL